MQACLYQGNSTHALAWRCSPFIHASDLQVWLMGPRVFKSQRMSGGEPHLTLARSATISFFTPGQIGARSVQLRSPCPTILAVNAELCCGGYPSGNVLGTALWSASPGLDQ